MITESDDKTGRVGMKKMIGVALCCFCAVTFSAYDWGKKPKTQKTRSAPVATVQQAVPKTYNSADQQVPQATADKVAAISALAKITQAETPEERQAMIESLVRISQALSKAQAQNPAEKKR